MSICIKSATQNTVFINLFTGTCKGYNCELSSGLMMEIQLQPFTYN